MAERRMFAKSIVDSDIFIEMPVSSRLLYYDLSMRADDDGFVNAPRKIMKFVGATNADMSCLIERKFVIPFESGVVVIRHWRIHNYIRKDTYNETQYKAEKEQLLLDENNAYQLECEARQRVVDESLTQDRLGKDIDRLEEKEILKKKKVFTKPSVEEVSAYCQERGNNIDAQAFVDFYESKGWVVGKAPMKDWKAAVRTWERSHKETKETNEAKPSMFVDLVPGKIY